MAIIVVGGSNRGTGKTALVCALIAALNDFRWNAVKITTREPGQDARVTLRPIANPSFEGAAVNSGDNRLWEETRPGEETDTNRYLAAGAARSFLAVAPTIGDPPKPHLDELLDDLWPHFGRGSNFIFESNSVVHHVRPNVCLMIHAVARRTLPLPERAPSFVAAVGYADAMVSVDNREELIPQGISLPDQQPKPIFHLTDLSKASAEMLDWIQTRLAEQAK